MSELAKVNETGLADLGDQAGEYARGAWAKSSQRAYLADWAQFDTWCAAHGATSLPAEPATVAAYLADLAQSYKAATIQRKLASISVAHGLAGLDSPTKSRTVRAVLKGIQRSIGTAQDRKAPVLVDHLRGALAQLGDGPKATRDRALLLIGHAAALRRSELVALDLADLVFSQDGLVITIRRSKTDQAGAGREIAIVRHPGSDNCPVRTLQAWLDRSGIQDGPVFRQVNRHGTIQDARLSDKAVARIVKQVAELAGLDPATVSGHSLRAGFATDAERVEVPETWIIQHGRWASAAMLGRYRREAEQFKYNATAKLDY